MTERDWLTADDPARLLAFAHEKATDRKLRLFACGCCRLAWNPFVPPEVILLVEAAERFADGELDEAGLSAVRTTARPFLDAAARAQPYTAQITQAAALTTFAAIRSAVWRAMYAAAVAAADLVDSDPRDATPTEQAAYAAERAAQADLARCVFGNPFRPAELDPGWLTDTVLGLARGIYADRAFDRLPILADALMDAGCAAEDVLAHCRNGGPHARGCWVVDRLLGRP